MIELQQIGCDHEGAALKGLLAIPAGQGPHPAVLVVHTAFGLGNHMRSVIGELAAEGYVALAVDMYGDAAYSEDEQVVAGLVGALWGNSDRLRARLSAWHEVIVQRREVIADRIAAIGYCFGGMCVLEFARGGADVRAVVSYHGILPTDAPARHGSVKAHVSVYTGGRDPHVPAADVQTLREEMVASGADFQVTEFSQACHGFTDPEADTPNRGRAYDSLAHQVSWAGTLALFNQLLRA